MNIRITSSSELIDDYKRLSIADSGKRMRAVTFKGRILLFSIGTDNKFYLTLQTTGREAAWEKHDLTVSLRTKIKKSFAVKSYDAVAIKDTLYLGVIVTVGGEDILYLSTSKEPAKLDWQAMSPPPAATQDITDVYMSYNEKQLFCVVDVRKGTTNYIERYFVDIDKKAWNNAPIALEVSMDSQSCIGRSYEEDVDGIYTLDKKFLHLIYTPSYNYYSEHTPPNSMTFILPSGSQVIAEQSYLDENDINCSNLFLCTDGALYVYPYQKQDQDARPVRIAANELLKGIKQLEALLVNGRVYVWGLNKLGELFQLSCLLAGVENEKEWTEPFIINSRIAYFCPLENPANRMNSYLGITLDNKFLIAEQSAVTSLWTNRKVDLPAVTGKDVVKAPVYRTKVMVSKDGIAASETTIQITPLEDGIIYVNGTAHSLCAGVPIWEKTNPMGSIVIMQYLNNDLVSIGLCITVPETNVKHTFNPGNEKLEQLLKLDSKEALRNARIPGSNEKLIAITDDKQLESVAGMMRSLKSRKAMLSSDGRISYANVFLPDSIYVLEITPEDISGYSGDDAVMRIPARGDVANNIFEDIGSFFCHCYQTIKKGFDYIKVAITAFGEIIIEMAGKVFSFMLDCFNKVFGVLKIIFEAIKTAIEKIIEFLKFLFDWKNILQMKRALGNCILLAKNTLIDQIGGLDTELDKYLNELLKSKDSINLSQAESLFASNLPPGGTILGKSNKDMNSGQGIQDKFSVTDTFLMDHLTSNISGASVANDMLGGDSMVEKLIDSITGAVGVECKIVEHFIQELTKIASQIQTMTFSQFLMKILEILKDTVLGTLVNVGKVVVSVLKEVIELAYSILTEKIHIPIISDILNQIGLPDFSILDVVLLVASFFITPVVKIVMSKEAFSKIDLQKLEKAKSLSELGNAFKAKSNPDAGYEFNATDPKKGYAQLLMAVGAVGVFIEGCFYLLEYAAGDDDMSGLLGVLSGAAAAISVGSGVVGSFLYSPCSLSNAYLTVFSFISSAISGINTILKICSKKLKEGKKKAVKYIGQICVVVGSIGSVIVQIITMNEVGKKDLSSKERTVFYLDSSSLFINKTIACLSVAADQTKKTQYVGIILATVRSIFALGLVGVKIANATQIAAVDK